MCEITSVIENSIADECNIISGDKLISINGIEIQDILDYEFYMKEEYVEVLIENKNGEQCLYEIEKDLEEDLGLEFDTYLMDKKKTCHNKCIFCFIDQMPKGMRESLYFKDDDARMSFLMGNYITMTNLNTHDLERIVKMNITPINISVHTTNPELRIKMMKNPKSSKIMEQLKYLADGGIKVNCQIVLCKDVNDKNELYRSMNDLALLGNVISVSIVPVGLSDYREGLYKLEPFTKQDYIDTIKMVTEFGNECIKKYGRRIFYLSDEFYLNSDTPLPGAEYYENFPQIENGVGLIRNMYDEVLEELKNIVPTNEKREATIITGMLPYKFIQSLVDEIKKKWHNLECNVIPIVNDFFGHNITVAGLVTGTDILNQLKKQYYSKNLLIPSCMLRYERDMFLDDITLEEVKKQLGANITLVDNTGYDFVHSIIGK